MANILSNKNQLKIKQLHDSCEYVASCLPNTKFVETKKGGYFQKGNRKVGVLLSPNQKLDIQKNFKLNKWKSGFGLNIHPIHCGQAGFMFKSVKKGLGIKD